MRADAIIASVLLGAALCAARAEAQLGPEGLLSNMTDVSFFVSRWSSRSPGLTTVRSADPGQGVGVELSFEVTQLRLSPIPDTIKKMLGETTWKPAELHVRRARYGTDSTLVSKPEPRRFEPRRRVVLEFALGYAQYSGFRSSDSALDLRGAVRELPSAAFYATYDDTVSALSGYVGVRTGVIQLDGVQLYTNGPASVGDSAVVWAGAGHSLEIGAVAGVVANVGPINLYVEYARMSRRIPSIQWTSGASHLPRSAPRELDFSGGSLSVGFQIHVKEAK